MSDTNAVHSTFENVKIHLFSFFVFVLFCLNVSAQNGVVFNRTEHDFGSITQSEVPVEQDFLFRNTSKDPVTILSVRSISKSLKFIHTRSEVFEGEYGFVKVKLNTQDLEGLFHDEVYITMRIGNDVLSEVIYLRAQIVKSGEGGTVQTRQFQDSEVATSVEVLPEDIESLEGFSGSDKLATAEAEIAYLRKQLGIKSELISKLSDDLQKKQSDEIENIKRLKQIKSSIKSGSNISNTEVLAQLDQLSQRLLAIQASDNALRKEIYNQEAQFARLRYEADSARIFANQLSVKLQEQFKHEAQTIEKANRLESDLYAKLEIEERQKKQIDSLEQQIKTAESRGGSANEELAQLKSELELKQKEQSMQTEHAKNQHLKIDELKNERIKLLAQTDSLSSNLRNSSQENQELQEELVATTSRISKYEAVIDSLNQHAGSAEQSASSEAQLDSIRALLAELSDADNSLKKSIDEKDSVLNELRAQRIATEKNLTELESASNKQMASSQELMNRVNQLSTKESEARLEVNALQNALKASQAKQDGYESRAVELESRLKNAHLSNELAFSEMNEGVEDMRIERDAYQEKYNDAVLEITRLEKELAASNQTNENAKRALTELGATPAIVTSKSNSEVIFKVNILDEDSPLKSIPIHAEIGKVMEYKEGAKYRYAIGSEYTFRDAIQLKEKMKTLGYSNATVVCFQSGERISLKDAMELTSGN